MPPVDLRGAPARAMIQTLAPPADDDDEDESVPGGHEGTG